MAFSSLQSHTLLSSTKLDSKGVLGDGKYGVYLMGKRSNFSVIGKKREATVTHVTTTRRPGPIAPSLPDEATTTKRNHVAWTSIRQHRWEGELSVQGEIPLWLVSLNYIRIYVHIYI